jgi:hypothetical protein
VPTFFYPWAFFTFADEVCGTSHVSQNFASFAIELRRLAFNHLGATRRMRGLHRIVTPALSSASRNIVSVSA